ncbi:MAG TPA: 5'-nucleotidase C-terminal domain-containing protein, partial [Polyangiaceae bacterium]|nr:5'-nucleotidase C-terminal domain-containing protein [Polyangiaceae bacterium]
ISTPNTTIAANFAGLSVTPLAEAVAREARALRSKGAEIVVALAHAGGHCVRLDDPDDLSSCKPGEEIFEATRALPPGAVDAIVAGHTHQAVAHRVAGIPIIESYANGKAFGRIDLTWDPAARRVVSARIHQPVELIAGRVYEGLAVIEPDSEVSAIIDPAIQGAAAKRAELLGVSVEAPIEEEYKEESALGNLVASLMLELDPEAQIAINNAGNLRADLPAGPLSYGSLYDSLPFDNRLARVMMSGRALADLFRRNLAGQRGILSVAGLRVEARCGPSGLTVNLVLEGKNGAQGRAIKDSDSLRVVTTDYLATGGGDFDVKSILLFEELDEAAPYRERIAEHLRDRNVTLRPSDWLKPGSPRIVFSSGAPACPPGK